FQEFHADAGRFTRLRVEDHDVARVDRRFLLAVAALRVFLGGPQRLADEVHVIDEHAVFLPVNSADGSGLTFVLAADHADFVTGFQAGGTAGLLFFPGHHSTSGASETMR